MKAGVFIVITKPNGDVLIQLRDDGKGKEIWFPNTWCIPGGTKETDETYLETVIREAYEEFSITLQPNDCEELMTYNFDGTEDTHVFICRVPQSQEATLREGAALKWLPLSQIAGFDLAFGQNNILPAIEAAL